jgi:hypothetical protein
LWPVDANDPAILALLSEELTCIGAQLAGHPARQLTTASRRAGCAQPVRRTGMGFAGQVTFNRNFV